ncbi:MAG: gatB [Rickettsiaceae bacterium]|jgi:aspartyl-tRNA(Asn)/glutamyl-tRNA(Gln) amidotransferase subunit B|nr:gatB [Rickettsiaceae bacterium]
MVLIKGNTGNWEYVIGLEVHSQITSNAKLFSGAPTEFGTTPNASVSLIDAAMPGMLPVLNKVCVEQAIRTGLGLNARINTYSVFDRKNYFYADLPQGYQISQFYHPIVEEGWLMINDDEGKLKKIRINRLHIEQDAGKSMHDQSPKSSFIDLNRAGIGLMEIVSEPDIRSPFEAGEYVKKLRTILRYLGTCDGDMEKGSLRCDANVSVRRPGEEYGTRCEIKNINSIRNIIRAIEFEAERQVEILESGGKIAQETRLFDADTGETRTMRTKEDSFDYRYFPDPDLLPLKLEQSYINKIASELPELPDAKQQRYASEYGLSEYDAEVLSADKDVADYYETVARATEPKMAANWITVELFGRLNKADQQLSECKIKAEDLSELLNLIRTDVISGKIAKTVIDEMFENGGSAKAIVEAKGLVQVTDESAINAIIDQVMLENPEKVAEYKSGKDKLFAFFVGQVMKLSSGKANPAAVNKLLKEKLG